MSQESPQIGDWQEMVEATEILSPESFRVFGQGFAAGEDLVVSLADQVYRLLYTRGGGRLPFGRRDAERHLELLSQANCSRWVWQSGWFLQQEAGTKVLASRNRITCRVDRSRIRARKAGLGPKDEIEVQVPGELRHQPAGFFSAFGGDDRESSPHRLRLYWNLTPAGAIVLVRELSAALLRLEIPWYLKVLDSPAAYRRADAGVLYLRPDAFEKVGEALAGLYPKLACGLRQEVPRLTLRLAPGLGLAERKEDGLSFGQHRCRLIAEALFRAFEQGQEPLPVVFEAFCAAGLDPSRPYLEPGSQRHYQLPLRVSSRPARSPARSRGEKGLNFLDQALEIGLTLCREALNYDSRCNWIAPSLQQAADFGSLGFDIYHGLSGVAFFLAELHTATGEAALAATARGAALQALRIERRSAPARPLALFEGGLGSAWALGNVGRRLQDEQLISAADSRVRELLEAKAGEGAALDFFGGRAGTLALLLDLYQESVLPALLEAARGCAEEIRLATRLDQGEAAWPNDLGETTLPWTGLAHGAAGIGLALLQLSRALGEDRSRGAESAPWSELYLGALAYEDRLFDSRYGVWPDLREGEPSFSMSWCNGGSGMLLARLRALQLAPELAGPIQGRVGPALQALLASLEKQSKNELADATLCHGTCGLIEVARMAGVVLGNRRATASAEGAMESLLALHAKSRSWPSGLPCGRPSPCLMLGEAGIGLALLHLGRPEVQIVPLIF